MAVECGKENTQCEACQKGECVTYEEAVHTYSERGHFGTCRIFLCTMFEDNILKRTFSKDHKDENRSTICAVSRYSLLFCKNYLKSTGYFMGGYGILYRIAC